MACYGGYAGGGYYGACNSSCNSCCQPSSDCCSPVKNCHKMEPLFVASKPDNDCFCKPPKRSRSKLRNGNGGGRGGKKKTGKKFGRDNGNGGSEKRKKKNKDDRDDDICKCVCLLIKACAMLFGENPDSFMQRLQAEEAGGCRCPFDGSVFQNQPRRSSLCDKYMNSGIEQTQDECTKNSITFCDETSNSQFEDEECDEPQYNKRSNSKGRNTPKQSKMSEICRPCRCCPKSQRGSSMNEQQSRFHSNSRTRYPSNGQSCSPETPDDSEMDSELNVCDDICQKYFAASRNQSRSSQPDYDQECKCSCKRHNGLGKLESRQETKKYGSTGHKFQTANQSQTRSGPTCACYCCKSNKTGGRNNKGPKRKTSSSSLKSKSSSTESQSKSGSKCCCFSRKSDKQSDGKKAAKKPSSSSSSSFPADSRSQTKNDSKCCFCSGKSEKRGDGKKVPKKRSSSNTKTGPSSGQSQSRSGFCSCCCSSSDKQGDNKKDAKKRPSKTIMKSKSSSGKSKSEIKSEEKPEGETTCFPCCCRRRVASSGSKTRSSSKEGMRKSSSENAFNGSGRANKCCSRDRSASRLNPSTPYRKNVPQRGVCCDSVSCAKRKGTYSTSEMENARRKSDIRASYSKELKESASMKKNRRKRYDQCDENKNDERYSQSGRGSSGRDRCICTKRKQNETQCHHRSPGGNEMIQSEESIEINVMEQKKQGTLDIPKSQSLISSGVSSLNVPNKRRKPLEAAESKNEVMSGSEILKSQSLISGGTSFSKIAIRKKKPSGISKDQCENCRDEFDCEKCRDKAERSVDFDKDAFKEDIKKFYEAKKQKVQPKTPTCECEKCKRRRAYNLNVLRADYEHTTKKFSAKTEMCDCDKCRKKRENDANTKFTIIYDDLDDKVKKSCPNKRLIEPKPCDCSECRQRRTGNQNQFRSSSTHITAEADAVTVTCSCEICQKKYGGGNWRECFDSLKNCKYLYQNATEPLDSGYSSQCCEDFQCDATDYDV